MSRYIDAETMIKAMPPIMEWLSKKAPTIDIVRCSECVHWRAYETWSECERWTGDPYDTAKTKADDFCSYGERSE